MPTRVKMPDGSIAQFPDGMDAQDIQGAIEQHMASHPAGLPAGMDLPGVPSPNSAALLSAVPAGTPTKTLAALHTVKDLGTGVLKGAANTASNLVQGANLPLVPTTNNKPYLSSRLNTAADNMQQFSQPTNTPQAIGRGAEQIGEFFIPGPAEESATAKLSEFAPKLKPLIRMGTAALGAGTVNSAQGGSFGTGAAGGAVGSGIGQGLAAIAPRIAESALNIRKLDRAYGKSGGAIGQAVLDETTGFSPSSVAESAQSKLNVLNPQLNDLADAASVKPNNVRGLLPAPAQEIPLGSTPQPPQMPGGLFDAQRFPAQNVGEARIIRDAQGRILPFADRNVEFPDENGLLPTARNYNGQFITRQPTRAAWMTGIDGEVPPSPEFGGPGVLLRRPEFGSGPIPTTTPSPTASLVPARGVLANALGTAAKQGERTTTTQLQPLVTHLGETVGGDALPENVTPRQLLDLKRGFGNEFIHRWNPETMQGVKGTAAQTYHALGQSFNDAVPGAQDLNSRISTLIPVAKRAESLELNAPTTQRLFQRIAAPTGALTGAVGGGYAGYQRDGATGAAEGAGLGLVAPLLLTTPTGQMFLARTLHRGSQPILRSLTGTALQMSDRNNTATTPVPK